jgi:hypothetical protein
MFSIYIRNFGLPTGILQDSPYLNSKSILQRFLAEKHHMNRCEVSPENDGGRCPVVLGDCKLHECSLDKHICRQTNVWIFYEVYDQMTWQAQTAIEYGYHCLAGFVLLAVPSNTDWLWPNPLLPEAANTPDKHAFLALFASIPTPVRWP